MKRYYLFYIISRIENAFLAGDEERINFSLLKFEFFTFTLNDHQNIKCYNLAR